jgi:16S rRNA (guanine966-N2)-methyltransferase
VRVIAGAAKGRLLAVVPGGTRPLADRAREGLFSSLGARVTGASFMDLFAGTGAVGIEALSRGASRAHFVESTPAAVRVIRENLRRTGLQDGAEVTLADVGRWVSRAGREPSGGASGAMIERFDVAFLDPPYAIAPPDLDGVLQAIAGAGLVGPGGLVVLTRGAKGYIPVIPVNWAPDRRLSYGDAVILAFRT